MAVKMVKIKFGILHKREDSSRGYVRITEKQFHGSPERYFWINMFRLKSCMSSSPNLMKWIIFFNLLFYNNVYGSGDQMFTSPGCRTNVELGEINLYPLITQDVQSRLSAVYGGVIFEFNPCTASASQRPQRIQPMLSANLPRTVNKTAGAKVKVILGTHKTVDFDEPNTFFCHKKHIASPSDTTACPLSKISKKSVFSQDKTKKKQQVLINLNRKSHDLDQGLNRSSINPMNSNPNQSSDLNIESMESSSESSGADEGVDGDDNLTILDSRYDHLNEVMYPNNISAVIKFRGKRPCREYRSYILLQCQPGLRDPGEAQFQVLPVHCQNKLYFMLSHRCCCPGLCDIDFTTLGDVTAMPATSTSQTISSHITNKHNIRKNDANVSDKLIKTTLEMAEVENSHDSENGTSKVVEEKPPKFMWLILVVNVGVLAGAILIAAVCCRSGHASPTHGPYNYLPDLQSIRVQALHSSNLILGSSAESLRNGRPRAPTLSLKPPDYLDYSTPRGRSAQLPLLSDCLISSSVIEFGQRLGGGIFGDTYVAEWKDRTLAAKRITVGVHQNQATEENYSWITKQVSYLSHQRHKCLVSVLGVCTDLRQPYVLQEYIDGESLKDLLSRNDESFTWRRKLKMCIQVADGMAFLHSAKTPVLHRDLRCANILIDKSDKAKVVDFGTVKIMQRLRQSCNGRKNCYCQKEICALPASIRWTAPEILQQPQAEEGGDVITPACDVYSFAMALWEVASHCEPFEDIPDENEVMDLVIVGIRPRVDILLGMIPQLKDLMVTCWDDDPERRYSFKQVALHLKTCLHILNKSSHKSRNRTNTSTTYLKSALNLSET